jgi:prepilin-type N-terminal cleavage/methylation domain-containing protein
MLKRQTNQNGYTLLELIVVVLIICILLTLLIIIR